MPHQSARDQTKNVNRQITPNSPRANIANKSTRAFDDKAGAYLNIEFTVTDNGSPTELDFEVIEITVGNVNRLNLKWFWREWAGMELNGAGTFP